MQALGEALGCREEAGVGVAQALGPFGHGGGQVVEDGGAPPLVEGGDLVAPLRAVHQGPVRHGVVLHGVHHPRGDGGAGGVVCQDGPGRRGGPVVGAEEPHLPAPLLGPLQGLLQCGPALQHRLPVRVRPLVTRRPPPEGGPVRAGGLQAEAGVDLGVGVEGVGLVGEGQRAHHDPVHAPRLPGVEEALVVLHHRLQVAHHVHPQAHRFTPRGGGGRARSRGAGSGAGAGRSARCAGRAAPAGSRPCSRFRSRRSGRCPC